MRGPSVCYFAHSTIGACELRSGGPSGNAAVSYAPQANNAALRGGYWRGSAIRAPEEPFGVQGRLPRCPQAPHNALPPPEDHQSALISRHGLCIVGRGCSQASCSAADNPRALHTGCLTSSHGFTRAPHSRAPHRQPRLFIMATHALGSLSISTDHPASAHTRGGVLETNGFASSLLRCHISTGHPARTMNLMTPLPGMCHMLCDSPPATSERAG